MRTSLLKLHNIMLTRIACSCSATCSSLEHACRPLMLHEDVDFLLSADESAGLSPAQCRQEQRTVSADRHAAPSSRSLGFGHILANMYWVRSVAPCLYECQLSSVEWAASAQLLLYVEFQRGGRQGRLLSGKSGSWSWCDSRVGSLRWTCCCLIVEQRSFVPLKQGMMCTQSDCRGKH
jgi:hypothetical protein